MPVLADLIVSILSLWALYALLSTAFSLSFRVGGFFDLSVGASFLVGAYTTWCASRVLPIVLAVFCAAVLAGVLAVVIGRYLIAPLAVRLSPLALFVTTLAVLYIAQSTCALTFGNSALVIHTGSSPTIPIGPARITYVQLFFVMVTIMLILALHEWLRRTPWGRFARAVADDRSLATLFGIPVEYTILRCYAASGVFAGLAGAYFVADRAIDPSQALTILLAAMVAAIIGGEAIVGAVVGALVLSALETVLGFWLPGNWRDTIAFAVLLGVLIARGGSLAQVVKRRI